MYYNNLLVVYFQVLDSSGQGWPCPDPGLTQGQLGLLGLGPGPAESGLTPRARVKGQEKWVSPGLTQPLDSVISLHRYCGF